MKMKSSRGQQVKTFTTFEPGLGVESEKKIVKVYFDAKDGHFNIYLPDHMAALLKSHIETKGAYLSGNRIYSSTLDAVMEAHSIACRYCLRIMRETKRKKVIVFFVSCNTRIHKRDANTVCEIGFCDSPALHLDFSVFWKVGDKLYQERDDGSLEHYGASLDMVAARRDRSATQIDWTQEREDFFSAMTGALEGLIGKILSFTHDLNKNPDKALANFRGTHLLTPPAKTSK